MDRTALYAYIGQKCNDPNHDRYTTDLIDTELDVVQDRWNVEAGIIKDTVTLTTVDGTRSYALSTLTGTPIAFTRVTHKGLDLRKRSKTFFDLYTGTDWSVTGGTPSSYYIDVDPDVLSLVVYPVPGGSDAGANLVVEYVKRHTSFSFATDTPFMSDTTANSLLRPYDNGVGLEVASNLLIQDPSQENLARASEYQKQATLVLERLIQTFKALEKEEPPRIRGGRTWHF